MTVSKLMNGGTSAFPLLRAIARTAKGQDHAIPYAPAIWLDSVPNDRLRARWSRLMRRMESLNLVRRHVDDSRDRVRTVSITPEGWNWIIENCGAGSILTLEELLRDENQMDQRDPADGDAMEFGRKNAEEGRQPVASGAGQFRPVLANPTQPVL